MTSTTSTSTTATSTVDQVTKVIESFGAVNWMKIAGDFKNVFKDPTAVIADVETLAPIIVSGVTIADAPVGVALGTGIGAAETLIALAEKFWPAVMLTTPAPTTVPPQSSS